MNKDKKGAEMSNNTKEALVLYAKLIYLKEEFQRIQKITLIEGGKFLKAIEKKDAELYTALGGKFEIILLFHKLISAELKKAHEEIEKLSKEGE